LFTESRPSTWNFDAGSVESSSQHRADVSDSALRERVGALFRDWVHDELRVGRTGARTQRAAGRSSESSALSSYASGRAAIVSAIVNGSEVVYVGRVKEKRKGSE